MRLGIASVILLVLAVVGGAGWMWGQEKGPFHPFATAAIPPKEVSRPAQATGMRVPRRNPGRPATASELPPEPAGVVRAGEFTGPLTGTPVRYNIYLPPGYDEGDKRYPVSYFLHGVNGNETSHNEVVVAALENAVAAGVVPPMIVVFPNGWGDLYWGDSKDGSKPAEMNVIRELVPHVDATYRTLPDRAHRIMQGYSMGGYGAVLYAVKFPELFGVCVSYDGALHTWETLGKRRPSVTAGLYGNDESYFNAYSPWVQAARQAEQVRGRVAIRLVVGSIVGFNRPYRQHLEYLGIAADYVETGCPHDLNCLLEAAGRDSFAFLEKHLGEPSSPS